MYKKILTGIATATALMLGAQTSNALLISEQIEVFNAASFNDQTNTTGPDLSSFSGADLSVLFKFVADTGTDGTGTTGTFSATVENISDAATNAIMSAIGINIDESVFTETGFTFTAQGSPACNAGSESCAFSSTNAGGLSGFLALANGDIAADADPAPPVNGLDIGDVGLFEWQVSFAEGAVDAVDEATDVFLAQDIVNTKLFDGTAGTSLRSFWIAHMISIDNYDIDDPDCVNSTPEPGEPLCGGSLKIGGAINGGGDVPEPGTLALFGVGLVGLSLMRRRRKAAA